jgi:phosphoribosyl-ATP pyrophosphohydrolase
MERLSEKGDDKMLLIKLQNEVNFLRKKQEEAFETLILKEAQRKEHLRDENSQKLFEEINLWQVKDTLALYESRIAET